MKTDDFDRIFLHVFAPAAAEFAEWVLQQAHEDKKERLYFLARDGYLFYLAARRIEARRGYGIELCYLSVSRYSIRSALYHRLGEGCIDLICMGGMDVTFETVMKRASLTEEEAFEIAKLAGYDGKYRQAMNYRQLQNLKKTLKQIPLLFQYIGAHAKECSQAAVEYLKQEGLTGQIPYAVVDSGWIGTLAQNMGQLIGRPVDGYYFGLFSTPKAQDNPQYKAFYFRPKTGIWRKTCFCVCLFETVFSAPCGMTVGYALTGENIYQPIQSEKGNPNRKELLREEELILAYMGSYLKEGQKENKSGRFTFLRPFRFQRNQKEDGADLVYRLFSKFMGAPKLFEAKLFGREKFCDDVLEFWMKPAAEQITKEDLKQWRLIRRVLGKTDLYKGNGKESAWPEASIVIYGKSVKWNLMRERIFKYLMYLRKAIMAK